MKGGCCGYDGRGRRRRKVRGGCRPTQEHIYGMENS